MLSRERFLSDKSHLIVERDHRTDTLKSSFGFTIDQAINHALNICFVSVAFTGNPARETDTDVLSPGSRVSLRRPLLQLPREPVLRSSNTTSNVIKGVG